MSTSKCSDIDDILAKTKKYQQDLEKYKKDRDELKLQDEEDKRTQQQLAELGSQKEKESQLKRIEKLDSKTFEESSQEKYQSFADQNSEVENRILDRLMKGFTHLTKDKALEIHRK